MRAQNQLSFADWQNLVLFTKKKSLSEKISGGGFRRSIAVAVTVTMVQGGGQWRKEKKKKKKKRKNSCNN